MLKQHGITANTPASLMFKAGVLYKNLKFVESEWTGEVLGATSGGSGFKIEPEYLDAKIDGATVLFVGGKNKAGEVATIFGNFTEVREDVFKEALHLEEVTDGEAVAGYKHYTSKAQLTDEDYLENVGFVGVLNDGRYVIVIIENAFCQSAIELETKDKNQAVYKVEFNCHGTLEQENLNQLPYHVYFPETAQV